MNLLDTLVIGAALIVVVFVIACLVDDYLEGRGDGSQNQDD